MTIFSEENTLKSFPFFKFANIGDAIEGTLTAKEQRPSQLHSGALQWVYEIMLDNGETYNVGGGKVVEGTFFDKQMARIRIGQIVGIKFIEERPNTKNPALNKSKIKQIYSNPKIVNEKWLMEHEGERRDEVGGVEVVEEAFENVPRDTQPSVVGGGVTVAQATDESRTNEILELMNKKFGVSDPITARGKAMELTNLAMISTNLDKILEKLKTLA